MSSHDDPPVSGYRGPEPTAGESAGGDGESPVSTTRGEVQREGVPEWLAVVGGVAVVLVAWFVISRPSVDTRTTGDPAPSVPTTATGYSTTVGPTGTNEASDSATTAAEASDSATTAADVSASATTTVDALEPDAATAQLTDLDTEGWRLLVGDGRVVVDVDLVSGVQTRHEGVGAPLALVDGRLLVNTGVRLVWSSVDDLETPTEQILEVPDLQRMLTRGRPADRPVVVGDGPEAAVWWPNNNADPQTWTKIRLADGATLDSIALTDTVFGGPDVVATIGSGTFERVDGRWVAVGDLFASSASRQAIVGQQCTQPDDCHWVLQRRGESALPPERLPIPLGGPFDLRLVADADRVLLRQSGGVTDHETGRFVPLVGADAESVTAVNRSHLLAMADGANIGLRSAAVTFVDLDGPPGRSVGRIAIDDLVPRWLVLVPPSTR